MKIITILLTGFLLLMSAEVSFSEETDETTAQEDVGTTKPYLSGGIGTDERDALSAEAKKYNLKIVFATKGKSYLADIAVKIKDESGKTIIDAPSDGPWFFTNLSQGKYTVFATMKEETLSQKLEIKQGGAICPLLFLGGVRSRKHVQYMLRELWMDGAVQIIQQFQGSFIFRVYSMSLLRIIERSHRIARP